MQYLRYNLFNIKTMQLAKNSGNYIDGILTTSKVVVFLNSKFAG